MERDQQIATALLERAGRAPEPPSLDAIRVAASEPHDLPSASLDRRARTRLVAVAAAVVLLVGGVAVWARAGRDHPSTVISGRPTSTMVTAPTTTTTSVDPPATLGTGWYVPGPLPGWTVSKAVAQAADDKGEAQLWLVAPSGATVIVSIKLPTGGPSQPADARVHQLPGQPRPAYLKTFRTSGGSGGTAQEAVLWADWPGATLIADVAPPPRGELGEQEAVDLLDAVVSGLHEADVETWRAFLGTVPSVDEPLRTAATLDDLPDACC